MAVKIKKMKPIDFIFLFGILGAICTAFALYYTWRQNRLSSDKTTQTLENTTEIRVENKALKEQVGSQSNKIDELRRENNELSSKLMDKSLDIYKNLTGDGNKPILIVGTTPLNVDSNFIIPSYHMIQFIIKNESKYPLRNVKVRITDFTGREMIKYGVKHTVNGLTMGFGVKNIDTELRDYDLNPTFDIAALSPNVSTLLYRTTYSPALSVIDAHYNVEVIWDNGHFIHLVTLKTDGDNLILDNWSGIFNGKSTDDSSCFKFGND